MNAEQKVAYVQAMCVAATCQIEAMKITNVQRLERGMSVAYDEEQFIAVADNYGLNHNNLIDFFGD